ncbi:glycosyltransferase [Teredinibacter waterburyi]|uniref:glycosyltransferase n=1 Tax=Teredinibacter waterburyi TaxID=1500538 RepID=UPI00165F4A24|nr:glycosyltransferase [Teredinibacter waterburyi]
MLQAKRIFFYMDANTIGGHEILTAQIANYLSSQPDWDVHCAYYYPGTASLFNGDIQQVQLPFHCKDPRILHNGEFDIYYLKKLFLSVKPDLIVVAQGYIESGVRGLIAARLAGIKVGSYIPFGQTNTELGNRFARLRDIISIPLYRMSQFYLTISDVQRHFLQRLVPSTPVYVINNPVTLQGETPVDPPETLGKRSSNKQHFAVVGRVVFKQKNQNILVEVAKLFASRGIHVQFHIVGDGPDLASLKQMVNGAGLQSSFEFHGWLQAGPLAALLKTEIDAVIMPSHYEGLPLVFLESVFRGKPVLVSDLPFTEDYQLPQCYRFKSSSAEQIADKIHGLSAAYRRSELQAIQNRVLDINSQERFEADIAETFAKLIAPQI